MAENVQVTDQIVDELGKVGVREGDTIGGTGGTQQFKLNPLGELMPAVITSDMAREKADDAVKKLADIQKAKKTPTEQVVEQGKTDNTGLTEAQAKGIYGTNFTGLIFDPVTKLYYPDQSAKDRANGVDSTGTAGDGTDYLGEEVDATLKEIDALKEVSDAQVKQSVQYLKDRWGNIIDEQRQANKQYEGLVGVAGIRSGRNRYATEIQDSIHKEAVDTGIKKVANLQRQLDELVLQAEQAQTSNDMEALYKKLEAYETAQKEQREAAQKAQEAMAKLEEESRAKLVQASRDMAVVGLVKQGVTDPGELLDYLNNTEDGTQVGDFTLDEVNNALKILDSGKVAEGAYKFSNTDVGKLLGVGLSLADVQTLQKDINDLGYAAVVDSLNPAQKKVLDKMFTEAPAGARVIIKSGSLTYTAPDYTADIQALEADRQENGGTWVQGKTYNLLLDQWVGAGGDISGFVKTFPPKYYVDPNDTIVPDFIRNEASKGDLVENIATRYAELRAAEDSGK